MLADYINCLLEFSSVLVLFLTLATFRPKKLELLRYYISSILFSLLFVYINTSLLLNISIFLLLPFLSFRKKLSEHLIFMSISVMCVIYLEFMCYSLLPFFLLQTNFGNLVANIIILVFLLLTYLFSNRMKYNEILNPLLLHHKLPIILFLLFTVLLGQSYLSRLSYFWSDLPGIISLSLFLIIFLSICIYVHYARSVDKLHIHMLTTHINDIEASIHSLRIQNHDYKHHIRNLRNQINTTTTLDELEVNTYIDQMEEDRLWLTSILNINQPVLRSVVYGCYSKCLQENIAFNFNSSDQLPNFPLKDYHWWSFWRTLPLMQLNRIYYYLYRIDLSLFAFLPKTDITRSQFQILLPIPLFHCQICLLLAILPKTTLFIKDWDYPAFKRFVLLIKLLFMVNVKMNPFHFQSSMRRNVYEKYSFN